MRPLDPINSLTQILKRQEQAWGRGERVAIEVLLMELPDACSRTDGILELVYNEVILREAAGESPVLDEYQTRFPEAAQSLQVQWNVDELFKELPSEHTRVNDDGATPLSHRIGRYQLRDEIGRGAMGVVYRAWDASLKRMVAIKRLRGGADAAPQDVERMRIEAEAIARVCHKHVIQIYDVLEHDGQPYLAMEYCAGESLAERLRQQPLMPRVAAQLIKDVAEGIVAAHAAHVLHRDLKPANILLVDSLTLFPKITDFGLARQLDSDDQATASGTILGSPAYMAPEQAFGNIKQLGPAADIYSIGAILYECLTGRPPFHGASIADTLDQLRQREPVPIRQLQSTTPIDLETIAHSCLKKDPSKRYASAEDLVEDLTRYLDDRPIKARRETWMEATVRTCRKYPIASSLAATAVTLLLFVTIGSLVAAKWLNEARKAAQLGQAEALIGRAHGIRYSHRAGQRFEALSALRKAVAIGRELNQPKEWYDPIRDEAVASLLLPDAHVLDWHTEDDKPYDADYTDDHHFYAISFEEVEDVRLRRFDDHKEVARIPKLENSTRVHFLDNSRLLLTGMTSSACEMWQVGELPHTKLLWRMDSGCKLYDISRDGSRMAMTDEQHLRIVDTSTGHVSSEMAVSPFARDGVVAMHPTEPLVIVCSYMHPAVQLRNWMTHETLQEWIPANGTEDYPGYTGVCWSPDGRRLLLANGHHDSLTCYRLDAESHRLHPDQVVRPWSAPLGGGPSLRFNARGDRILGIGWNGTFSLFDSRDVSVICTSTSPMFGGGHSVRPPRFTRDGKDAGFSYSLDNPNRLGVLEVAEGREALEVVPSDEKVGIGAMCDPSSRFLVGAVPNGLIFVDAINGQPILKLRLEQLTVVNFAFDDVGHFWTNGPSGCIRWPYRITTREDQSLHLHLEVPQRMPFMPFGSGVHMACSDDGKTVVAAAANGLGSHEYAGCWIKSSSEPTARKLLGGASGTSCGVSPSGRYAAACMEGQGNLVWDCEGGVKLIKKLGVSTMPRFSRDNGIHLAGGRRWSTNSWKSDAAISGGEPFDLSPDGRLVLTKMENGDVGLNDASSGKVLTKFEWRNRWLSTRFIPDGSGMYAWSEKNDIVRVDFALVRKGLEEMGLDWELPSEEGRIAKTEPLRTQPSYSPFPQSRWTSSLPPELQQVASVDEWISIVDQFALDTATAEPNNCEAVFMAAMIAMDHRHFEQARNDLNRVCEMLPEAYTPRMWRAYLQAEMLDYEAAISDATWVIDLRAASEPPIDQDLRLMRAQWCYQEGLYEAAIRDCTRVVEIENSFPAYGLRAACFAATGQTDWAQRDEAKFMELDRYDSVSLNMFAEPMSGQDLSLRLPTVALKIVRILRSRNEKLSEDIEHTIGRVLYQNGIYEEAIEFLEKSLSQGRGEYDGLDLYCLAMCQLGKGDADEAVATFEKAEAWKPSEPVNDETLQSRRWLRAEARSGFHQAGLVPSRQSP